MEKCSTCGLQCYLSTHVDSKAIERERARGIHFESAQQEQFVNWAGSRLTWEVRKNATIGRETVWFDELGAINCNHNVSKPLRRQAKMVQT